MSLLRIGGGALLAAAMVIAGAPTPVLAAIPLVGDAPERTVGFDGLVYASVYSGNTIYLGGSFHNAIVDGKPVVRKRLAALDARTGKLLSWAPVSNGTVTALTADATSVYAAGRFTTIGTQPRAGLAGLDLASGAVTPLKPALKGLGQALAVSGGRLFVGGTISSVDGKSVGNLAVLRLSSATLDDDFKGSTDGEVRALAVGGDRLYVGGAFKKATGTDTARLAALRLTDGQVDTGFRPATPYTVMDLSITEFNVYAGLAGPGGRVASYKPDGALVWSTVTDGDIQALTVLGEAVYAGGHFTVSCTRPSRNATAWCPTTLPSQPKFAAFNTATGWLEDWNPRSNGKWGVLTMSVNPDLRKIAAGGEFTTFDGTSQQHFAQFKVARASCEYGCGGGRN